MQGSYECVPVPISVCQYYSGCAWHMPIGLVQNDLCRIFSEINSLKELLWQTRIQMLCKTSNQEGLTIDPSVCQSILRSVRPSVSHTRVESLRKGISRLDLNKIANYAILKAIQTHLRSELC